MRDNYKNETEKEEKAEIIIEKERILRDKKMGFGHLDNMEVMKERNRR